MKNIIFLFIFNILYQFASAQIVPRTYTLPGIANPAFPYAQPEEVGLSKKNVEELGDEIATWVANGELIGGELLIIKDGKTIMHEAYGWSEREENSPIKRNSIWSIKSMSKPFTATAIMMLAEEGKLSINDKLIDYIPEYVGNPRTSISDMLSHTTGHSGLGNEHGFEDIGSWVTHLATLPPTEEYGTYQYADFNFATLGYIVELVSQMKIEDFIQLNLLNPMQLNDSYTNFSTDSSWASNVNSRYKSSGNSFEKFWSNTDPQPWTFYPAAWGIWGTAMDYSKFLTMILNQGSFNGNKFLSEHTIQDMISTHSYSGGATDYGYGFQVKANETNPNTPVWFGHGGSDGTLAFAYPEDNLIVIFMTHSRGTKARTALRDRIRMLGFVDAAPDRHMVRGASFTKPILHLTNLEAESFLGDYKGPDPYNPEKELLIRIELNDNQLRMRLNSYSLETGSIRDLFYLDKDRFLTGRADEGQIDWINSWLKIRFRRKNEGITSLEITGWNKKIFAEKVID